MPSSQHEVNQVNEAQVAAPHDSILQGALNEMMKDVHTFNGPKVMNNTQQSKEALNGNEAIDKAQKMLHRHEQGSLDVPPLFAQKDNSDACGLGLQKQEMRKQFYDKLGTDVGGELKKSN